MSLLKHRQHRHAFNTVGDQAVVPTQLTKSCLACTVCVWVHIANTESGKGPSRAVAIPLPVLSLARSPKLVTCQIVRPTICCRMAPRDSTPTRPCSHLGRRASATSVLRLRGFGASPTDGKLYNHSRMQRSVACVLVPQIHLYVVQRSRTAAICLLPAQPFITVLSSATAVPPLCVPSG